MDNYILKYINNILFIAYNDYAFEIYEKPKLDFSPGSPPVFMPQIPAIIAGTETTNAAESKNFIK